MSFFPSITLSFSVSVCLCSPLFSVLPHDLRQLASFLRVRCFSPYSLKWATAGSQTVPCIFPAFVFSCFACSCLLSCFSLPFPFCLSLFLLSSLSISCICLFLVLDCSLLLPCPFSKLLIVPLSYIYLSLLVPLSNPRLICRSKAFYSHMCLIDPPAFFLTYSYVCWFSCLFLACTVQYLYTCLIPCLF